MVTLAHTNRIRLVPRPGVALWLAAATMLTTLLVLLSIAIKSNPAPSQDLTVMDWLTGWDPPGLSALFHSVSTLTNGLAATGLGLAGIITLWFLGMRREALAFAVIGGIVGLGAFLVDFAMGEMVTRARPLAGAGAEVVKASDQAFPSGHVFGGTALFGFWGFLAICYRVNKRLLVPFLFFLGTLILAVGASRIYVQAHWPSDVAAGYLLGFLLLMFLIPFFLYLRKKTSVSFPKLGKDLSVSACASCRVERSIASTVVLDPEQGTATKVYRPPAVVRLLYWLAFQASFPYSNNAASLQAAVYRRKIASFLTRHRFGKDLVAPVTSVDCINGQYSFITEFVPGEKVKNDQTTKRFVAEVTETFAQAGLSVWQINPRNPHAHTNLIRTPEGNLVIIDLESAVVTPVPAPGQWRSVLRSGDFPIFDDIDFPRLRQYVSSNEVALAVSLGSGGVDELNNTVNRAEQAIRSWKDSEPRIWGRLVSGVYKLLNWEGRA